MYCDIFIFLEDKLLIHEFAYLTNNDVSKRFIVWTWHFWINTISTYEYLTVLGRSNYIITGKSLDYLAFSTIHILIHSRVSILFEIVAKIPKLVESILCLAIGSYKETKGGSLILNSSSTFGTFNDVLGLYYIN